MNLESFMDLVHKNNGFEFVIGYKDFIDHRIGGQDNKYWYYIDYDGKKQEYYVGTYKDNCWSDKFYIKKGNKIESKTIEEKTTIQKILERAYFYQDKIIGQKPQLIEKHGYRCNHYMFDFGEKAVDIIEEYKITSDFNDINNNDLSYHLRDILIGKNVEKPKEK